MARAAAPPTVGYSGKPIWIKLGIKPDMDVLGINAPSHYDRFVEGSEGRFQFAKTGQLPDRTFGLVHLFCANVAALVSARDEALASVAEPGMLWISWPKKTSELFIDLTGNGVRTHGLETGWVDVKVCAIDVDWSGLKFLRRRT